MVARERSPGLDLRTAFLGHAPPSLPQVLGTIEADREVTVLPLLLGLLEAALAWPGPTALVLVLIVGTWAVIAGVVEIGAAFAAGEPTGVRALFILGGLVSIAFGAVLFARPGVGASPFAAHNPLVTSSSICES